MPPFTSKSAKAELKLQMSDIKDDIATMVAIRQLTGKRTLSIKTSREQLRTMIYVYNGDLENAQKALTKYREICTGIIDGMMESSTNTGMIDICSGAPSVVQGDSEKVRQMSEHLMEGYRSLKKYVDYLAR
jgi:hypothetical protein